MSTRRERGFTLIELMMVLAVLGILCTIAVVSYTRVSRKVHHDAEVGQVTAQLVKQQEAWKTDHGSYLSLDTWPPLGGAAAADMPPSWRQLRLDLPATLRCQYVPTVTGRTFSVISRCP